MKIRSIVLVISATVSLSGGGCAKGVEPADDSSLDASPGIGGSSMGGAGVGTTGGSVGAPTGGSGGTLTSSGGARPSSGGLAGGAGSSTGGAQGSGGAVSTGGAPGSAGTGGVSGSPGTGGVSGAPATGGRTGSGGTRPIGCNDAAAIPLPPGCQPKPPAQCGNTESSCMSTAGCREVLECVACSGCQFANNCTACQSVINQYGGTSGSARSAADNVLSCHGC